MNKSKNSNSSNLNDSDSSDTDGSLTSFSETESEPDAGYIRRNKRRKQNETINQQIFLGIHQRIWMILFLILSAIVVLILCIYGDAKQLDVDHWEADEILPELYLGNYKDALNRNKLHELGITHILTIALGFEPNYLDEFNYMTIRAQDHSSQDILSYVDSIHEFIDKGRKDGGILVHCKVGQSRSGFVVTSYVMKEKNLNGYESLEYVKKIRPIVRPRRAFLEQLEIYNHYKRNLKNIDLQKLTDNYPNKAQITIWPSPKSLNSKIILEQPEWVKEEFYREWWDAIVHHFMDFYNRYLRYYEKK